MKLVAFLLILAALCSLLLYFGTHADDGTIRGITMTIAFLINFAAIIFCLCRLPSLAPGKDAEPDEALRALQAKRHDGE